MVEAFPIRVPRVASSHPPAIIAMADAPRGAAEAWGDMFLHGQEHLYEIPGQEARMALPFAQNPTLFRAMLIVANVISSVPYELFKGESDEPVKADNSVKRSLEHPNDIWTFQQLVSRTVLDYLHYGQALWQLGPATRTGSERGAGMFPGTIRPVPGIGIVPMADPDSGELQGWRYYRNGTKNLPKDQGVYFFQENPYFEFRGVSALSAGLMDAIAMFAATISNRKMVQRGGPEWVLERQDLTAADVMSTESAEDIEDRLESDYRGERDHGAYSAPPGYKVTRTGATPREMDYEKLIKVARENVAGAVGTPPSTVGILEFANYSNMDAQLEYLFFFTADPIWNRIEQVLQLQLLDRFSTGLRGFFKREVAKGMVQNMDRLTQVAERLHKMAVPFEEINARLELGIDTDKYPWLSEGFIPMGMVPASEQSEAQPGRPPQRRQQQRGWPKAERHRAAVWQRVENRKLAIERRFLGDYRAFLKWLGQQLIAKLPQNQSRGVFQQFEEIWPASGEIDRRLHQHLEVNYTRAIRTAWDDVTDSIDSGADFALSNPRVKAILQERFVAIKAAVVGTEHDSLTIRLRRHLAGLLDEGASIDTMASSIREYLSKEASGWARSVARTEIGSAYEAARYESMSEAGVTQHEWISARDARVREDHEDEDGNIVAIGDTFPVTKMTRPLAFGAPPEQTMNCRCITLPVE